MKLIFPPLKKCPWCGSDGQYVINDLGKENGRGYPGCHELYVECNNIKCKAQAPYGHFDDIYRSIQEAVTKAAEAWNKRKEN